MIYNHRHWFAKIPAGIERVVALDTGYMSIYDGTRIIVSGYYNANFGNPRQYAAYIQSIDNDKNVYTHNAANKYGHLYIVNNASKIFTQAFSDTYNGDNGYSVHDWNVSTYAYTSMLKDVNNDMFSQGMALTSNYLYGFRFYLNTESYHNYVDLYNPTTGAFVSTIDTGVNKFCPSLVNGKGMSESFGTYTTYNAIWGIGYAYSAGFNKWYPSWMRLSSSYIPEAAIMVSDSTITTRDWQHIANYGGDVYYISNYGHLLRINMSTGGRTYIRGLNGGMPYGSLPSLIDGKIYFSSGAGAATISIYDIASDTFSTKKKIDSNSIIISFVKAFDDDIYGIEWTNDKLHYLVKLAA